MQQKAKKQDAMKWKAGGPNCKFLWQITALFLGVLLLASCGTDAKESWEEVNPWDAALSEIEEQRYLLDSFDSTAGFEDGFLDGSKYVAEDENFRLLYSDEAILKYAHMILHLRFRTIPELPFTGYEAWETKGFRITSISKDEDRCVCLVMYSSGGTGGGEGGSFLISMKTGEVIWYGYG